MIVKPLLIVLFFALAACSTVPEKPEQPGADSLASLPVNSRKVKIVKAAIDEWIFFGRQKVVIDGDEESIPHVGIWEDADASHSDRINQYWSAVGEYWLSGNDCNQPWSAAFIGWIMQAADVSETLFPRAIAHQSYLNHFLANAHTPGTPLIPHTIQEYKPKPGDLICANRGEEAPTEAIDELPDSLKAKLHCDIVVETTGQTLHAIGGNVRNSVSKTILTLSPEGYLQFTSARPWLLIIENRLD